ncbi:MAG: hypothetical protein KDA93_27480 [Planctomycetaceae bacterium]|nr:hypothetical protein [Planctomycetaceae bacterium]
MLRLLSCVVIASVAASAEAQVSLNYSPAVTEGTKIRTEMEVENTQTMTIAGMALETQANNFATIVTTIDKPTDSGGYTSTGGYEVLQADLSLPGGFKVQFNSNNPGEAPANPQVAMIHGMLKAMAPAKWSLEMGADHKVLKAEFIDGPIKGVSDIFKHDLDPERIKERGNNEVFIYATEPVKPGESWTRVEKLDLGSGQSFELEREYTYVGPEEKAGRKLEKVTVAVKSVDLQVADNPALPAKVSESELKVESSEGTLWYDPEQKLYVDTDQTFRVKGSITLTINGMDLPGELDLTMKAKSKSSVTAP